MQFDFKNGNTYIKNPENFDIALTLDCGQAFRWEKEENLWRGFAFGTPLRIEQTDDEIILYDTDEETFKKVWYDYFDIDRNYAEIIEKLSLDSRFSEPCKFGGGIRLLNQEPWETLCSFIISQNNNIPRIKGIIDRLCRNFGNEQNGFYSFPSAEDLADKTPDDLSVLRAGFRSKYIIDAAKKVANKTVDLEKLPSLSIDEARDSLMQICGVGPKVADCTLLFSLKFKQAFPKDVWIKRIMEHNFGGVLPECAEEFAGIAQQYLFHYARTHGDIF